jgi:hypothetical protein
MVIKFSQGIRRVNIHTVFNMDYVSKPTASGLKCMMQLLSFIYGKSLEVNSLSRHH